MRHRSSMVQTVYVVRDFQTYDILEDRIASIAPDRFKSSMFRYTFYKTGDFFSTRSDALIFCRHQKAIMPIPLP